MGHRVSWRFLPSLVADWASFILLENSRRVSSMSSKPGGGGLRLRFALRMGGIVGAWLRGEGWAGLWEMGVGAELEDEEVEE